MSEVGTGCNNFQEEKNEEEKILHDVETLEAFTAVGFKMLVEATKKSNSLPFGKARDLYESYPSFHSTLEKQADHVLSLLSGMLQFTNPGKCIRKKDDEDKFEMIVDSNDVLLEKVGILLDELSGLHRNPKPGFISKKLEHISGSWNENKKQKVNSLEVTQVLNKILNQTKSIEKPQLKFKDKINNDSNMPFEPKITYKYNMLKPLACILEIDEYGLSQFSHPYEFELEKFKPLQEQLTYQTPVIYKSFEETPLVLVTSPEDVKDMVKNLEKYKEIAVDLEHHSYRSFQGFTCLMQISTRDTDYIIDALSLRSDLEILNKVFTNPGIVKVFHGADLDTLWLQRDLALYIVNMFDTHQAAKALHFPKLSLGYLLSHYCEVNAQKQFQLADWRVRPLPQELLTYARGDTHYLLHIYDNLRNALIEKANNQTHLLESVISESTKLCLKRYFKPAYETDGYLDLYHRSKKLFDNRQKFALQQLFKWRDTVARESDESYAYVLPNHMMLNISEVLPREAQGILACCNPVPALVRQNLVHLHQIILKAREQLLVKPVLEEQRFYKYTTSITSFDNPLQCPHDLNHESEFRDDLPVLFSGNDDEHFDEKYVSDTAFFCKPFVNVFESSFSASEKAKRLSVAKKVVHLSPYHQYKLSKKFSESVEVESISKKQNFEKMEESTVSSAVEKESNDRADEINNGFNKNVENLLDNKKSSEKNIAEQMLTMNENKKEQQENVESESSSNAMDSSVQEMKPSIQSRKKKNKKRNFMGGKEKEFQPFDFKSVDFEKYQTAMEKNLIEKRARTKLFLRQRGKKAGKKNFAISI